MARRAANATDYRALAKARLPHFLFEYLDGGSYDEVTLRRNVEDLQGVALRQRVLRDVSKIDLGPAVRARMGDAGRLGPGRARGTLCAAGRGAGGAGRGGGERAADPVDRERLLAPTRSRRAGMSRLVPALFRQGPGFVADLIATAKDVGCGALVLTVDLAVPGSRYRDRAGCGPAGCGGWRKLLARPGWLWDVGISGRPISLGNLEPIVGSARR